MENFLGLVGSRRVQRGGTVIPVPFESLCLFRRSSQNEPLRAPKVLVWNLVLENWLLALVSVEIDIFQKGEKSNTNNFPAIWELLLKILKQKQKFLKSKIPNFILAYWKPGVGGETVVPGLVSSQRGVQQLNRKFSFWSMKKHRIDRLFWEKSTIIPKIMLRKWLKGNAKMGSLSVNSSPVNCFLRSLMTSSSSL